MNNIQEYKRYKKRNFSRLIIPISSLFLVGIGILFSVVIYMEEGWSWHVPIPPIGFSLFAALAYSIYRKGNDVIEIGPDSISHMVRSNITKTLKYTEITVLKYTYTYARYMMLPTIELKGINWQTGLPCTIDFDGEMEDFYSAVQILFRYLKQNGRDDLLITYDQQFKKFHGVTT